MSFLGRSLGPLITGSGLPSPERNFLDLGLGAADAFAPPGSGIAKMGSTLDPYAAADVLNPFGKIGSPDALGAISQAERDASVFQGGKLSPWNLNPQVTLPSLAAPPQSTQPGMGVGQAGGPQLPANSGGIGSFSDDKSVLNQYDALFQKAASKYGLSANDLKAIAGVEQGWGAGAVSPSGAIGIMQVMPQYWGDKGYDIYTTEGNIMAGALAYKTFYDQYHDEAIARGMDPSVAAARAYLAGNPWSTARDDFGTGTDDYGSRFSTYRTQLGGSVTSGNTGFGNGGSTANAIVEKAKQFIGVPYVWGGIPGKGETPTGWDCSGMTYWMDQNWGTGTIPMGSHYQYDYAQRTGKLFTDSSQLQPGDLLFIDTGWMGGAGSELNQAGHVGIYIGNGQMINALNPEAGTVISNVAGIGRLMGAMHMSWSGGDGGSYNPNSTTYQPSAPAQTQAQRLWGHATGNY